MEATWFFVYTKNNRWTKTVSSSIRFPMLFFEVYQKLDTLFYLRKKYDRADSWWTKIDGKTGNSTYFWSKTIFIKFFNIRFVTTKAGSLLRGIIELHVWSSPETSDFGTKNTLPFCGRLSKKDFRHCGQICVVWQIFVEQILLFKKNEIWFI